MPSAVQMHVNRPLTNLSFAYMQKQANYIADTICPVVSVQHKSDTYYIYNRGDMLRDEMAERADGTESRGGDYSLSIGGPYLCKRYAFHKDITEEERANADAPLNADRDATDYVSLKALIHRENMWANSFFKDSVWGTDVTGVASTPSGSQVVKWSASSSTPIEDIAKYSINMAEQTGFRPNTLVISPRVFYALKNHEEIISRIQYTQKGIVTTDLIAELLEVDRVLVAWGIVNTAAKGAAESNQFVFGSHALLAYVNPTPGLKKPSACYTFAWNKLKGVSAKGTRIRRIPMPWKSEGLVRVEVETMYDMVQTGADLGVFFKDII